MSNHQSMVLAFLNHGALTYFDLQTWIHRDESFFITGIDFGDGLLGVTLGVIS